MSSQSDINVPSSIFKIPILYKLAELWQHYIEKICSNLCGAAWYYYGITDEYHQSFVPGCTASLHDLVADGIGVTIAHIANTCVYMAGTHVYMYI